MHIAYSRKAEERARQRQTAHQRRRRERFVEENKDAHDDHFGTRAEFGKRSVANKEQAKPRRTFNLFKPK